MVKTRSARGGNSSKPLGRGQVPSNLPPHPPPPNPNTFPPVDHAEGEDENQPHNSVSNSASTANQDVVTTQLAAMQQQFGPPAPPQNPDPVQHAPTVNESQGQSHIAPIMQPPRDDVTRRLDSLEKLVVEQRGVPPPHPATDSVPHPLNTNIILEPYPAGFRIPQLETYDGTKDPDDHLHAFYSCMQAQNASDALMCKIFPFTLRVLEVNSFDQVVGITAVISGLGHKRFRDSLLKHPATTFSEIKNKMDLRRLGPMRTAAATRDHTRVEQPRFVREQGPQHQAIRNPPNRQGMGYQQAPPPLPPPTRVIHMITGDEAISSVLVREEAKQQKPIYYISSVLHGAELRYPLAEKATLAVVTSARKLRPYFQSHPIIRSAIRAQALADFVVECTPCHSTTNPEPNEWTLYVDGASSSKGSGAGALLIGPDGYRSEHALKFNFDATNNMAEYEALLLGLQLALELKISAIQVYSDSQLVVNQINSIYEVVDPVMIKYVALVAELKCKFQRLCLSKIPRAENEQADSLSKFASDSSSSSRSVFVEVLDAPSFTKPRVMEISTDPGTPSWTDSIVSFLRDGVIPEDKQEAMRLRKKASRYTLVDGILYKRSFSLPLLRCLNPYETEYALREVHEGVCGSHIGARTLTHKVLRQGYYWPNMYKDATHFVQRCMKCQFFAHITHQPAEELTTLVAPWPFAQWGLDLLGPFVKGVGSVTHLIVGVDYFTKWVEARPLSSLTSKKAEDFVFSSIIWRYGIPNQIVADNGTQFNCTSFQDFCSSYRIKLQFTSVYHPESNGMVESVNKCILEGIKPRLEQHKAKWADELNNVLWAYRTTSQTATGETPYHLAFGTEAVIHIEIGVPSFRVTHFDERRNGQLLRENLDLLDDVREEARLRTLVYKQKIANFYNKRVRPRTFKVGDLVLRKAGLTGFETRFGKLAPNWEGPYTVAEVPHPGAYILRDTEGNRVPRVRNVNNLKKFYP
ncbi:hypothetical protein SLEP1_g42495 [Rubroshorea leprosula]|uniref:Uncharacterized protein n=1 Tax=Rubroshorea leprosula TaxID=152421 RepID=A0AAV5L9Y7_9ROSI|nr:hypothetical protein SLEP1_g42495 [Rubroshorea leprosula]